MAALGRAAVRGTLVTLGGQGIRFAIQMASLVVMARLLSPREFGLVAMVTAVIGVAEIIRDFGLSSAAIQAKELSTAQRNNLFWINTGIGAACALVAAAAAPALAHWYGQPELAAIVWALCGLMIVSGANTQLRADLSRRHKFTSLATSDVLGQGIAVCVAIGAALAGLSYWSLVAQQATLVIVVFCANAWACRWLPGLPDRRAPMRALFRYGWSVFVTHVIGYATNNADNIAIGKVWGEAPLGLYGRAYQLLIVPLNQLNAPLSRVMLPTMSKAHDDPAQFALFARRSQLIGSFVLGLIFAVAGGLSAPLTAIMFGPQWGGVAPVFTALAIGGVFRALTQTAYLMFLAAGLPHRQLRLYLWTRPVMIAILLAGLPWGPFGVAVGHSVAFAAYYVVSTWRAGVETKVAIRPFFGDTARILTCVLLPAGLVAYGTTLLMTNPWLQVLAGGLLALCWVAISLVALPWMRSDLTTLLHGLKALKPGPPRDGRHRAP